MKNIIMFTDNDAAAPMYNFQISDEQAAVLTGDAVPYQPSSTSTTLTPVPLQHKAPAAPVAAPAGTRNLDWVDLGTGAHFVRFTVPVGGAYINLRIKGSADHSSFIQLLAVCGSDNGPGIHLRISRWSGGNIVAMILSHPLPGPIPDGAKVTFVATTDDKVVVLIDDELVEGAVVEHPFAADPSVTVPGTLVSLEDAYSPNPPVDIEYGAWDPSVNITAVEITEDGRPRVHITYNDDGIAPTQYEFQIENVAGTVVQAWGDAVPVATSEAGVATLESARFLPLEWRGSTLTIKVREKGKETVFSTGSVAFPSTRRFGENIADGTIYYAWQPEQFRDWKDRMTWNIEGGQHPTDGVNGGLAALTKLYNAGLIDRDCRLLSWPSGASAVFLANVCLPARSECGPRLLKLAPNQDFNFINAGGGTTTVQKNLATGEHVIDFVAPADGSDPKFDWRIILDPNSFVAGQNISFRKVGDNSVLKLTDNFVAKMSKFSILRMMDLLDANNGGAWETFDEHIRWGWQPEAIAELFNRAAHPIPYFVPGYKTTPEVFAQFMEYFETNIDRSIPAFYFDPSNEVWGGISSLRKEFIYRAALNGRWDDGYQAPIDPANIHRFGTYDVALGYPLSSENIGPISIPKDDYVLSGVAGVSEGTLFRAKRALNGTASIPVRQPNGSLIDNDDFKVVANLQQTFPWEYGAYGYALTVAGKAVCSRLKAFAIGQTGDGLGENSFLRMASDYALTPDGTDTWGSILDGYCNAPYAMMQGSDHDDIGNAPAGAARVALLKSIYTARMETAPARAVRTLSNGAQAYFASIGRTVAPIVMVYECGMEGSWWSLDSSRPAGIVDDFRTFFDSDELADALAAYYTSLFDAGAANVCAYRFGPGIPENGVKYGPYDHFRSLNDTTSGTARADLATAAAYTGV